jgi:hypothetical protein
MSADPRSDELDGERIRRLAAMRRATYRARSYFIIAAITCGVVAIQLAWMGITHFKSIGLKGPAMIVVAFFSFLGMTACLRRACALHRQAKHSALPEPSVPPDFSTLGDGSEQWKNLHDVR